MCLLAACSGTKKYFKAAERLEKQGLINDAAEYYLESLQRKPTNVDARIKLKEVGQKAVSNMASEFFRNYNTQQTDASLESFERMKDFVSRTSALNVNLDYPKQYEEDYRKSVETYCDRNHDKAYMLVKERKYGDAMDYIGKIRKYDANYKSTAQLEIVAFSEPLYQSAVTMMESKNYAGAFRQLSSIKTKTENYKDLKNLYELAAAGQLRSFMLFEPKGTANRAEKDLEDYLFNNFNQVAVQKFTTAKIINNTPFTFLPNITGGNAADVDLIQAIRKATGSDYFYAYDISNIREYNSGLMKSSHVAYQEVKVKKNDTLIITEYQPVNYNLVKANRSYSYQFSYKLINAYTNQIVSSQSQNVTAQDAIEYNEFARSYNGNINNLYPYNPQNTAPAARYNPSNWRKLFNSKSELKGMEQLKEEANNKTIQQFSNSVTSNIK